MNAVQKRPLRAARRPGIWGYGSMGTADPYLQRWGGGLRATWHFREGLSAGFDVSGLGTWATQELVIAKRELHARVLESHERAAVAAVAAIAPIYRQAPLPRHNPVHLEPFLDAGLRRGFPHTPSRP